LGGPELVAAALIAVSQAAVGSPRPHEGPLVTICAAAAVWLAPADAASTAPSAGAAPADAAASIDAAPASEISMQALWEPTCSALAGFGATQSECPHRSGAS